MAATQGSLLWSRTGSHVWGCISSILKRVVPSGNGAAAQQYAKPIHCNYGQSSALRAKAEPGDPLHQGRVPEYIPQRKAKSPMRIVALAWAVGFPSGILLFLFAKREVDKKRLEQLKVRQRMKASNEGEYESGRYRRSHPLAEAKS